MNQNDTQIKLSEEQKQKLHEQHLIQQRELYDMFRRHQQEQLQIFEQLKEQEQIFSNLSGSQLSREIKQSNPNYSQLDNLTYLFEKLICKKCQERDQDFITLQEITKKQNSNILDKPYTLSQYKLLKLQQGLGPTLSIKKWEQSKDKMDRMLEFAEYVKLEHRQFKEKNTQKLTKISDCQVRICSVNFQTYFNPLTIKIQKIKQWFRKQ